jgi:hypothetical protein
MALHYGPRGDVLDELEFLISRGGVEMKSFRWQRY